MVAGTGAVGLELARVSLSESAAGALVRESGEFPANLSLAFLPRAEAPTAVIPSAVPWLPGRTVTLSPLAEGRTVVFYLAEGLRVGGNSVERLARLTVGHGEQPELFGLGAGCSAANHGAAGSAVVGGARGY